MRKYIGFDFDSVKIELQSAGYKVEHIINTYDDKHRYDATLVVRITENNGVIYLTTSDFALNTL